MLVICVYTMKFIFFSFPLLQSSQVNATANATDANSTTDGAADEPVRVEINPETTAEGEKTTETAEKVADVSEEL